MDIATFGLKLDTSGLDSGIKKLDKLGSTGKSVESKLKTGETQNKKYKSSVDDVGNSSQTATGHIEKLKEKTSALNSVYAKATSIFAALGLSKLATDAFNTYRSMESMSASLKTVTGSAEAASAALAEIKDFAKTTPYTLDQSVQGFQKLKALGLDPSMSSLRSYGNTAAAMGKDLMQMIEAVADASTGEFERLKEFGIKAKSEGDNVALTFQGVTTTIGKNSEEIQQYLLGIGNNQFGTAMSDQMNTAEGAISNLKDSFANLQVEFMTTSGAADLIKNSISGLSSVIQWMTENTDTLIGTLKFLGVVSSALAVYYTKNMVSALVAVTAQKWLYVQSLIATTRQATNVTKSVGMMGVATVTTTAKVSAATLAARGLAGAMALLGGPVGLFALAASAAFIYKDQLLSIFTSSGQAREAEEKRNGILEKVKGLSNSAATATDELAASNKREASAALQAAQAGLQLARVRAATAREEFEQAKAIADDMGDLSGSSILDRISGDVSEGLEAATSAAKIAEQEYKAQLQLVKDIESELQNFGKSKITIPAVNVQSSVESVKQLETGLKNTETAATGAKSLLTDLQQQQEKQAAEAAKIEVQYQRELQTLEVLNIERTKGAEAAYRQTLANKGYSQSQIDNLTAMKTLTGAFEVKTKATRNTKKSNSRRDARKQPKAQTQQSKRLNGKLQKQQLLKKKQPRLTHLRMQTESVLILFSKRQATLNHI